MNIDFMLFPSLVFHRYINTFAAICNPNIAIVFYNSRLLEVHAHTESCRAARFINGGRGNACYSFSSFFFSFLFVSLITFVMLLMISFGWFWLWNAYYNVCVSALLTGSPDCSILATDVETGSTIARLDNAHEWVDLLLWLTCHDLAYRFMCVHSFLIFYAVFLLWCRGAVNRLINLTESTVASGDDEGCIKVTC